MAYDSLMVFAGNANPKLAADVVRRLNISLGRATVGRFSDGEITVEIQEHVRGKDVFILQSTCAPANENLMELLVMVDALKRASAARITAVVPYLCYGRSDKKDQPRIPITSRLVADMIQIAGADRYMTLDPHAYQIQGFFSIPGDVLNASSILVDYVKENLRPYLKDPVVVTVDLGFAKKGRNFAAGIDAPIAFIEKRRAANDARAQALTIIGDVKDRDVVLVDDEIDTGGSIAQAIFSASAVEKLAALPVTEYITTDSVQIPIEKREAFGKRLTILTVAPLLGEVIRRAHEGRQHRCQRSCRPGRKQDRSPWRHRCSNQARRRKERAGAQPRDPGSRRPRPGQTVEA